MSSNFIFVLLLSFFLYILIYFQIGVSIKASVISFCYIHKGVEDNFMGA